MFILQEWWIHMLLFLLTTNLVERDAYLVIFFSSAFILSWTQSNQDSWPNNAWKTHLAGSPMHWVATSSYQFLVVILTWSFGCMIQPTSSTSYITTFTCFHKNSTSYTTLLFLRPIKLNSISYLLSLVILTGYFISR